MSKRLVLGLEAIPGAEMPKREMQERFGDERKPVVEFSPVRGQGQLRRGLRRVLTPRIRPCSPNDSTN
jgi:hypothetical protein